MSTRRLAHIVSLVRRAAVLEAGHEPLDPVRAAMLHRVAATVSIIVAQRAKAALSAEERAMLLTEARELTGCAAREVERVGHHDLQRAEKWAITARAFLEIFEATRDEATAGRMALTNYVA